LAEWVDRHLKTVKIDETAFRSGDWLFEIETLLDTPRRLPNEANGADVAANAILDLLST
jgi:hypothetical protein